MDVLGISRLAASRRMSALVTKGWLGRVRRGVYSIRPLDAAPGTSIAEEDPWAVAARVFDPCYIGGWTAAGHWNLTEQLYRATLVVTERRVRRTDTTIGSSAYHVVREKREGNTGLTPVWRNNSRILVSSVERTLIDACGHPDWVGGGREMIAMFRSAVDDGLASAESMLAVARETPTGAALGRLAVLVDRYWPSARELTEYAAEHRGAGYVRFDPNVDAKGPLNTRWGVWLNVSFDTDAT
ncbi:MAG: type IV toxin-antitoxin system AbiEi family antitoxin domain-containing protein [Gemmatimonadaceae bacterium]